MGCTAAASPAPSAALWTAAESRSCLGGSRPSWRRPSQQMGPGSAAPNSAWPMGWCCSPPYPDGDGLRPPVRLQPQAALAVPGPVDGGARFHGLPGVEATCFPEAWRRDYFRALFRCSPRESCRPGARCWANTGVWISRERRHDRNHPASSQEGQKARPQARLDPGLRGSTGLYTITTPTARVLGLVASPCWLFAAGQAPYALGLLEHGGTVLLAPGCS